MHFTEGDPAQAGPRDPEASWKPKTASASCCWRRPYHNDPGINHDILEEFQKLGYPVLTLGSLPIDDEIIWNALRRGSARRRHHSTPWTSPTPGRTPTARTPARRSGRPSTRPAIPTWWRSSFPASSAATTRPSTPRWKRPSPSPARPTSPSRTSTRTSPAGSIKIRVETISYFLKRYREDMVAQQAQAIRDRRQAGRIRGAAARRVRRATGRIGESAGVESEREELQAGSL